MFTYIIPNRFFIFPTHVGKLLHLLQKKRPGFKSETGRLSKNYLLVKCLPLMREVAKIYDF